MSDFVLDKSILNELFKDAQQKDEFEFCCTLLRLKGLESAGWDSLEESLQLINQVLSLINAPIDNGFKIRMSLMLYCHITEMNDFYKIVANLLWVLLGERYTMEPFFHKLYEDGQTVSYPEGKVRRIKELAIKANKPEIGNLYDFLLIKQVRNAFFHSDYTLFEDTFRIVKGQGINIDGIITSEIPLEWLIRRIEVAINTALQLINLLLGYRKSYKNEKIVRGRMQDPDYCDITLVVNEGGLSGFRC